MPTDTSNTADAGSQDDDDGDDLDKKKIIAQRQKLKARVAELEAKEKERADEDRKREEAKAREAQDWAKLEKAYQAQLKERDDQLAAVAAEKAAIARKKRAGDFASAVTAQAGLPAEALASVRAHLLLLQEEEGMDIAPEEGADVLSKEAVKKLRKSAPSLFQPTSLGPNGRPGVAQGADSESEELKRAIASLNRR